MWDIKKLEAYLCEHLEGFEGPVNPEKFSDGQSNPTFLLTTPGQKYVLRQKPPGTLLKSAHAVDREYIVQRALSQTEVPVAEVFHFCEDESIIDSTFYVMEYLPGRIFWNPALAEFTQSERASIYDEMNRVLAAIHNVDITKVGLESYGRPGNYFARQLSRWSSQYEASATEQIPEMNRLIAWLEENSPEDDTQVSLVHGDYRIDNLMFHPDKLEIIAVFDWELSTLGHPMADLSYQIMQRYMGTDWYIPGLAGIDTDKLGIPSEQAYIDHYCERRDYGSIEHWAFYKAFSFFRFAAICQGVKKRALEGNASSDAALQVGQMARPLAELGWNLVAK